MSRKLRFFLPFLVIAGLGVTASQSGCVLRTSGSVGVGVSANAAAPRLVSVSPGVYVVEDYGDSVFYSDGFYWRYDGASWYRSSYYDGGWVTMGYNYVPVRVRGIRRPRSYTRYRGRAGARYYSSPARRRAVRNNRATQRDNRAGARNNRGAARNNRAARKQRANKRDERGARSRDNSSRRTTRDNRR